MKKLLFNVKNHLRTSVIAEIKNKKIILTAIKLMSAGEPVSTTTSVPVNDFKALKSYKDFRKKLTELGVAKNLQVDFQAKKSGLSKNTAYDNCAYAIARVIDKEKFIPANNYETKTKSKKIVKK
jgi:hypothetical protein